MIDLNILINRARELQPLPASTVRLASLSGWRQQDVTEIVEVIAFDQVLTAKLLKAANSVYCGSSIPVTSVRDAVFRLGSAQVMSFAVAYGTKGVFLKPAARFGLPESDLWRHSVAAAVAAEVSRSHCQSEVPAEAFTAALLHDIGKLVIQRFLEPEVLALIQKAQVQDGLTRIEAETNLLRLNHCELGGIIAEHWHLPERIICGIIHHHTPNEVSDPTCDVVCLANLAAKFVEARLQGNTPDLQLSPEVATRLRIDDQGIGELFESTVDRFAQIHHRYEAA